MKRTLREAPKDEKTRNKQYQSSTLAITAIQRGTTLERSAGTTPWEGGREGAGSLN